MAEISLTDDQQSIMLMNVPFSLHTPAMQQVSFDVLDIEIACSDDVQPAELSPDHPETRILGSFEDSPYFNGPLCDMTVRKVMSGVRHAWRRCGGSIRSNAQHYTGTCEKVSDM